MQEAQGNNKLILSSLKSGPLRNEWQSFRTKKDRGLELKSVFHECGRQGRRKIAVKVVDLFGNDTMKVINVTI